MTDGEFLEFMTNIGSVLVAVVFAAGAVSVIYTRSVYRKSQRRSIIFAMMVRDDILKIIAGSWFAFLIVIRLVKFGELVVPAWTVFISAIALAVLMVPIIDHAVTIYRLRRDRKNSTPPPWADGD